MAGLGAALHNEIKTHVETPRNTRLSAFEIELVHKRARSRSKPRHRRQWLRAAQTSPARRGGLGRSRTPRPSRSSRRVSVLSWPSPVARFDSATLSTPFRRNAGDA